MNKLRLSIKIYLLFLYDNKIFKVNIFSKKEIDNQSPYPNIRIYKDRDFFIE